MRLGMARRRHLRKSLRASLCKKTVCVLLAVVGLCLASLPLAAQTPVVAKLHRIGVLWPGASPPPGARMEWFRQGLREFGYVEGQNIAIDLRYAETAERLGVLAGELVQSNVSVIATFGDLAPTMARRATSVVPIVALADDFVGAGLAPNLARPGGNLTGVSILSPELSAKRLAVLKELIPKLSRVAVLWDPAIPEDGDGGRRPIAVRKAPGAGGTKGRRPRQRVPSREERAGRSPQCLRFAAPVLATAADHGSGGKPPAPRHLPVEGARRGGGAGVVWTQPRWDVAADRSRGRQDPERRQTRQHTHRAADSVRAGHQHEDGQVPWSDDRAVLSPSSRSDHRVTKARRNW